MRNGTGPEEPTGAAENKSNRLLTLLGHLGTDVIVAVVWAALVVAIVLFSGAASQFTYVDF